MIYNRSLQDYYSKQGNKKDNLVPFLLGRNAINYLVESLSIKSVVLPSFICPMVVDIFKHHQVEIFYYEGLGRKLEVPVDDILNSLSGIESQNKLFFLWHDYLNIVGDIPDELYDYLSKNSITPIVDATHSLPIKSYQAEIVIYGFRKLLNEPFGALVKLNIENTTDTDTPPLLRFWWISLVYRMKSTLLFLFKYFNNSVINKPLKILSNIDYSLNFDSNHTFLYDNFQLLSIMGKHRRLDYQKICNRRQINFLRYAEKIPNFLNLMQLDTSCPYGFPLLINNNTLIRKKLWDKGIHSFILWSSLHKDLTKKNNRTSDYLSASIVILPVNHDLNLKDIDSVIKVINER